MPQPPSEDRNNGGGRGVQQQYPPPPPFQDHETYYSDVDEDEEPPSESGCSLRDTEVQTDDPIIPAPQVESSGAIGDNYYLKDEFYSNVPLATTSSQPTSSSGYYGGGTGYTEDEYDEEVEAADNYQFQERVVHVSSYGRRSQVPAGMASQQQQQQSHGPRGH